MERKAFKVLHSMCNSCIIYVKLIKYWLTKILTPIKTILIPISELIKGEKLCMIF